MNTFHGVDRPTYLLIRVHPQARETGGTVGRGPAHHRTGTTRGVAPRSVRLSSPERVLFPDEGITKQDLFEYYRAIAPVLVPHLRNRPFTMKRSPYGVDGEAYFQKQAPKGMPSWIPTRTYRLPARGRVAARRLPARQLAGGGALDGADELHRHERLVLASTSRTARTSCSSTSTHPTGGFALAIRVAHLIREELSGSSSSPTSRRAAPTGFTCSSRLRAERPSSRPTRSRSAWREGSRSGTRGWSRPNG